jgi:hypothetical protein
MLGVEVVSRSSAPTPTRSTAGAPAPPTASLATGLVECKTAGLASGFGDPEGLGRRRHPLGYEFQCRWSHARHGRPRIDLIGLVAGMGVLHRSFERDLTVEADMVEQVSPTGTQAHRRGCRAAAGRRRQRRDRPMFPA